MPVARIDDHEFLEAINVAITIARKRKIDMCYSQCFQKLYDLVYCEKVCNDKYRSNTYFTKADFIKALVHTDLIRKYKIETLLRKLRKYAQQQRYIKYIDKKNGVYKALFHI